MADTTMLHKIAYASDLCAFIARRGDGIHVAIIHLRAMDKDTACDILDGANRTCRRITHFQYHNDQGGIDQIPRDAD